VKVGVGFVLNNWDDDQRFLALEDGFGDPLGDAVDDQTWSSDMVIGDLVEPLGFDSIWTVEHHFSPAYMMPDPLQFLSFWAGRTERIGVGTMVIVLPWHNPIRVAEQIVMLQHMMGDRDVMIGFGRGLGRREYGGFDIPMSESRERFDEAFAIVRGLIANERFSHKGDFTRVPDGVQRPSSDLSIRPRPSNSQALLDNFFVSWGSPMSVKFTAHLGMKPLIIPQRDFDMYIGELQEFNSIRQEAGLAPANGTVVLHLFCSEDEEELAESKKYFIRQRESANVCYEFGNDTIKATTGYEYYKQVGERLAKETAVGEVEEKFNIIGTPEQVLASIHRIVEQVHPDQIVGIFRLGGMPVDLAEKSMRLFASSVLPQLHELSPLPPIVA
jgi:alkanesulfonate monooxygenase SsuD/methylene tetrahydromethanopterin reductase-like flavin-dependent oxidoreductase (luciferase family)